MNPEPARSSDSPFATTASCPLAGSGSQNRPAGYLDPDSLAQLGSLEIVARQVVEGLQTGRHHNPMRGIRSEFRSYRQYAPGDETRHLDWKAYARCDRYYTKLCDAGTNANVHLLLDASQSMTYASGRISKLDYATYLAASLAWLAIKQGDPAGLAIFDGKRSKLLVPQRSLQILHDLRCELGLLTPQPRTNLGAVLHEFARGLTRPGFVMLCSDLLDHDEEFLDGLRRLRFGGHNVVLFHTLDPCEIEFPLDGRWRFTGIAGEGEVVTQPARVRASYLHELAQFVGAIRNACAHAHIDYLLVNTRDPVAHTITNYLLQRTALVKARQATLP